MTDGVIWFKNDETLLCLTIYLVLYKNVTFPTICNPNFNFSDPVEPAKGCRGPAGFNLDGPVRPDVRPGSWGRIALHSRTLYRVPKERNTVFLSLGYRYTVPPPPGTVHVRSSRGFVDFKSRFCLWAGVVDMTLCTISCLEHIGRANFGTFGPKKTVSQGW